MEAITDVSTLLLQDANDAERQQLKTACRWAALLVVYAIYRLWNEGFSYSGTFRADGRVVIVTGANAGVGRQTAVGLAARGARVYLACRNERRALAARDAIIARTGNPDVHYLHLDLASMASVRQFVRDFERREQRLHVLVNNAAVLHNRVASDGESTADGLPLHMGVNHYGHFLLTALLMDRLKAGCRPEPSRIVNVSSNGHGWVQLEDYDDDEVNETGSKTRGGVDVYRRYLQSKLANVMFTKELARRLNAHGSTNLMVNCVQPGWNMSQLLCGDANGVTGMLRWIAFRVIGLLFFKTTWSAAQTTLYAALDVNLQSMRGEYFADQWLVRSARNADNVDVAERLWRRSETVTGVKFEI